MYGKNISAYTPTLTYPGVHIKEIMKAESPNYLFVTLEISPEAKAGKIPILLTDGKKIFTFPYELKDKSTASSRIQGFDPSDVIYLIMPACFANGNTAEDNIYVYFRYSDNETVMVVMNNNSTAKTLSTERFAEQMNGFNKAKNVVSGEVLSTVQSLIIPANTAWVLELRK